MTFLALVTIPTFRRRFSSVFSKFNHKKLFHSGVTPSIVSPVAPPSDSTDSEIAMFAMFCYKRAQ